MSKKKGILTKDKMGSVPGFKTDRFRSEIRRTKPHRHSNYLEVIYLDSGEGEHIIDDHRYPIDGPTLFILKRNQVHCWNLTEEASGYVLLMKDEWPGLSPDPEFRRVVQKLQSVTTIRLNERDEHLEVIFQLLYDDPKGTTSSSVRRNGLLKALLGRLGELLPSPEVTKSRENRIIQLNEILSSGEYTDKSVNYFANLLNTSPQNLNTICRRETGSSAAEFIAAHLISEAKRMLSYSNFSVSEIATQLHFKDHSHFSGFFRKHVGQGPKEYRMNHSF